MKKLLLLNAIMIVSISAFAACPSQEERIIALNQRLNSLKSSTSKELHNLVEMNTVSSLYVMRYSCKDAKKILNNSDAVISKLEEGVIVDNSEK